MVRDRLGPLVRGIYDHRVIERPDGEVNGDFKTALPHSKTPKGPTSRPSSRAADRRPADILGTVPFIAARKKRGKGVLKKKVQSLALPPKRMLFSGWNMTLLLWQKLRIVHQPTIPVEIRSRVSVMQYSVHRVRELRLRGTVNKATVGLVANGGISLPLVGTGFPIDGEVPPS
jgi:hypothetical protein